MNLLTKGTGYLLGTNLRQILGSKSIGGSETLIGHGVGKIAPLPGALKY